MEETKVKSKWKDQDAQNTAFDELDYTSDIYIDIIIEVIEARNKYMKRAEFKPMATYRKDLDSHVTSRAQHMRQAAIIAKRIAHELGVNEAIAYIGMLLHDAGHAFFGHEGEHTMNEIGKLLNCGYFHHNAKGIDIIISERIIEKIIDAIPEAKSNPTLREQLKEDAYYFLDVVVGHDGESTLKDTKDAAKSKVKYASIKEAVFSKASKANRENIYKCQAETLETQISKPADVIAYLKTDMLDAFSQGIITKFSDDYLELIGNFLCETEEKTQEIENARKDIEDRIKETDEKISAQKEQSQELKTLQTQKDYLEQKLIEFNEKTRKLRIKNANQYIDTFKKKHLRETEEDIHEATVQQVEELLSKAEERGANIYYICTGEETEKEIREIKSKYKGVLPSEARKEIKELKLKYEKEKQITKESEDIINKELEIAIAKHVQKRKIEGANDNIIAAEVNRIRDYTQKMTKSRKRVVEEIMNELQDALIIDYVKTTKKKWEQIEANSELSEEERYEQKKGAMGFSERTSFLLLGGKANQNSFKGLNYNEYVQYSKMEYQTKSVPKAVLKTVEECARALVETGIIRDKFYDETIRTKIKDEEVKKRMITPVRTEQRYEDYKRSIGISNKVKLVRPKVLKEKTRFKNILRSKQVHKNKLFKDLYSYTQRQGGRFATCCEDVYYAIEHIVKTKVENALNGQHKLNMYLPQEEKEELQKVVRDIYARYHTKKDLNKFSEEDEKAMLEEAKQEYIEETIKKERANLELKVATQIAINYLAGNTDRGIKKLLIKTGNLSKLKLIMEDRQSKDSNEIIKKLSTDLTKEHASEGLAK